MELGKKLEDVGAAVPWTKCGSQKAQSTQTKKQSRFCKKFKALDKVERN